MPSSRFSKPSASLPLMSLVVALGVSVAACVESSTASTTTSVVSATTTSLSSTTTTTSAEVGKDLLPDLFEGAETYAGLPVGFTEDGYPYLGDPDAPVSLVEFSDYLCPFCGRHFAQTTPDLLERYGASGQVNFVFRDFPLASLHPNAPAGHAAALCVAEQGAVPFWAFHDELFAGQQDWEDLPDTAAYLSALVQQVGADVDAYLSCIESGRTATLVDERVEEGQGLGFSATPSFHLVDNRTGEIHELVGAQPLETFVAALDAVIAGEGIPTVEETPDEPPPLPFWASEEGLAPAVDRPGYTVAGDAYRGSADAPLVVIEISDFQCPFCLRHTIETQPAIDEMYVDTGQVRWVYKHLPLAFHPQAAVAAAAAECAGDQQAFWEMHDLLFATVEEWSVDPPDSVLVGLAVRAGLDEGEFASCLGGRAALERVLDDIFDLSSVVPSTPTFIVVHEGRAGAIEGAQPLEQFVAVFDGTLNGP